MMRIRELFGRPSLVLAFTALASALFGAVVSHVLWTDDARRAIPLDEWRVARQEPAAAADLGSVTQAQETESLSGQPRADPSAVSLVSAGPDNWKLLREAPAFASVAPDWPRATPDNKVAPAIATRPRSRREAKPARVAASAEPTSPNPTVLPPPPDPGVAGNKEQPGMLQKSQDALTSAPSRAWSAGREAANSIASFGSAVWDGIAGGASK